MLAPRASEELIVVPGEVYEIETVVLCAETEGTYSVSAELCLPDGFLESNVVELTVHSHV